MVDHRSGHLISMLHTHLSFLSSQSKPKKQCSQKYWDWRLEFSFNRNNDMICLCFYKFDKLAISIYLVHFTSLILVFSTSASQAQLTRLASGTCIHTHTYSQMIQRRWQENRIFCHPYSLSLPHMIQLRRSTECFVLTTLWPHAWLAARWHGSLCFRSYIPECYVCTCVYALLYYQIKVTVKSKWTIHVFFMEV